MPTSVTVYDYVSNDGSGPNGMLEEANAGNILVGDIVETIGYQKTWVSDPTVEPIGGNRYQLVDAGADNDRPAEDKGSVIYVTADNGRYLRGLFPTGTINVEQFGAVGDGTTDNHFAITKAIEYATNCLNFGVGDFVTSKEIVLGDPDLPDKPGLALVGCGAGSHQDGIENFATAITGTGTTGAVVRIMIENCSLKDMLIKSGGDRLTASRNMSYADYNCGVRVEGNDEAIPEGDVFGTVLENVHVYQQPNDGITLVGRCYRSRLTNVTCNRNNGHGFVTTSGAYIGRDNTVLSAIIDFEGCTPFDNMGHGWKVGAFTVAATDPNDPPIRDYAYRISLRNSEGRNNCGDENLLLDDADSFFNCDGLTVINGAFKGQRYNPDELDPPPANFAGVSLMGNGGTLMEVRILKTSTPVRVINDTPVVGRKTSGWSIVNPHIRDSATTSYILYAESGIENIYVWAGDEINADVTEATNTTNIAGLSSFFEGEWIYDSTASFRKHVDFYDDALFNTNVTVQGSAVLDSTLRVNDDAEFIGKLRAEDEAVFIGTLRAEGLAEFVGTLRADGSSDFNGVLVARDVATFNGTLEAVGNAVFNGTLRTEDEAEFNGILRAQDEAVFNGKLRAEDEAVFNSTMRVEGEADFNDTLRANAETFLRTGLRGDPVFRLNNLSVEKANQAVLFNGKADRKMWRVFGRHIGQDCKASFSCDIVSGDVGGLNDPIVSNLVQQSGATVAFALSVDNTTKDILIELTQSSSVASLTADIFVFEVVID